MEITLQFIKVRDIVRNYIDNNEEGVFGYDGKLNIRPPYQREFVYDAKKRDAVIDTITKGFPLNVMYWAKNNDGTFELLDGQQRTISICQFVNGDYSINNKYFHTLTDFEQEQILNYDLMIYFCEGNDKDRLDWFRTINIAGEKLTEQELLNANYTGTWLSSAKLKFSKTNCVAYKLASKYVNGSPIRQDYLETALSWISGKDNIAQYMADHQKDENANELYNHFVSVIEWIERIFPKYRREMKGLSWGELYSKYKDVEYDVEEIETMVKSLMEDDDVTNKKGIYEYVLSKCVKEKCLNIRTFSESQKRGAYERQNGICPKCGRHFEYEQMQGDHIVAWSNGGKTDASNLQMLCRECNNDKSNS